MLRFLAVFITFVATSMTAVAAWDRGGTPIDKTLLVSMSVVIVLAVHLLPAISRRPITWLVWAGCLICAVYGHLTFLTHASMRAGQTLAQQSALAIGTQNQVDTVREALAQIKARPVAEVMAQLAQTNAPRVRAALRAEIAEGKKAEAFRNELVRLSQVSTAAHVDGAVDPVTAKLAQILGVTEGAISIVIGLTFALLVELVGAVVWFEALRPTNTNSEAVTTVTTGVTTPVTQNATDTSSHVTPDVTTNVTRPNSSVTTPAATNESSHASTALKAAIESGQCKATVNDIRAFLGCSQAKASELRRSLAG